ncbi:MAG TPA: hypothetical protein PKA41_00915 [Verrucomicrobiota bacterium]|nr:hypothetical protein [Verrucomicrobiota bacterium]
MTPPGIITAQDSFTLYWLLTGVGACIDLNRMSTTARRDFPAGVSGSHMALKRETCFLELRIEQQSPPSGTYLLTLTASDLKYADYRSVPSQSFTGQMYSPDPGYSQQVFIDNSGKFAALSVEGLLHYSAPAYGLDKSLADVLGLFPAARHKLKLDRIEPLGLESPPIPVLLFGATEPVSSVTYYR